MALWVIAITLALYVAGKFSIVLLNWYVRRTQYYGRSRFKKTLNWILNGSFD